jgi:ATP-binding cassette subfamily B protein
MENSFILGYMVVLLRVVPCFSAFQKAILDIIESYGPLQNIVKILDRPAAEEKAVTAPRDFKKIGPVERITVKDLSFSYKDKDEILRSVDAAFFKGRMAAIVGFSGEGKSTFLDLLVGIRTPKRGRILFNDLDINEIDPQALKDRIGYVNQEPLIFHDTIHENITFFRKDMPAEKVDSALEMASIRDFVYSLPKGLDTGLGERGLTVSGGERQRIGLARVFLKDAQILLLDEATNSLDYRTEKNIYDNLKKMKNDKIIIVVAHRLSSLADFDDIIVMYKGRVEERGAHKELMERKGVYYSLYKLQEIGEEL